jgi:hypothetical protein
MKKSRPRMGVGTFCQKELIVDILTLRSNTLITLAEKSARELAALVACLT